MSDLLSSKVKAQSLVDVVAARIEAAIMSGELRPGTKLTEPGLALSLGVSRGPLREAMRRLEGRKLLERTPNIGVRVAQLSSKDLHDVLEIREALEGMACGLAAQNMSDEEIKALEKLLDEHARQKSVQVGEGYYQEPKDHDFHFRIVKGSGNQRLIDMLCGDLYDVLRVYRYKSSTKHGRTSQALNEHREIVAALAKRDLALAETKMREHLRNARIQTEAQAGADEDASSRASMPSGPAASRAPRQPRKEPAVRKVAKAT